MRSWTILFSILISCGWVSCKPTLKGSGNVISQKLSLANFNQVLAGEAFELTIRQDQAYQVEVFVDDNLAAYLDVGVRGDELQVAMKHSHSYSPSDDGMRAVITMPELTGVDLSGAAKASLSGFSSQKDLTIELSGASELQGGITAANVSFDLSGASELNLQGSGQLGKLELSGASQAALFGFQLQSAQANLSGASKAEVNVVKRLEISASGASDLVYAGEPEMGRVSTSGASSVSKR